MYDFSGSSLTKKEAGECVNWESSCECFSMELDSASMYNSRGNAGGYIYIYMD